MYGFFIFLLSMFMTLVMFVLGIPAAIFFPYGDMTTYWIKIWGQLTVFFTGTKLKIIGAENILMHHPVVFAATHQSLADIPFVFSQLPVPTRIMAKKSLIWVPVIGWAILIYRFITVNRKVPKKALKSLDRAAEKVQNGVSVLLFAEGTRGDGRELLPFKTGPFMLAIKAGVPIVPVLINGTNQIHNKKHPFRFYLNKEVSIRFLEPVSTKHYSLKERTLLKDKVEKIMRKNYSF